MKKTFADTQSNPQFSTVAEKIILEKRLPFNSGAKQGPTVDLFFHELTIEKSMGQKFLQLLVGTLLGIVFITTLPFIALFIKMLSGEPVFRKIEIPGRRGMTFHQYKYTTEHSDNRRSFGFGAFLQKTKLNKLPSIINVWKGDMDLIGPYPYPANRCNKWNEELSDFYKRFALKPGYIGITNPVDDFTDTQAVAKSLKKELRYIVNPTLKKDIRHIFGAH